MINPEEEVNQALVAEFEERTHTALKHDLTPFRRG